MRRRIRVKKESRLKQAWKKIWDFLWNSNSIWSWIADLLLLYIIVKFVFFPLLGLIFATSLPSVIVQSESMEHGFVHPCAAIDQKTGKCIRVNPNVYQLCGENFDEKQKESFDLFWQTCGAWYGENNITKSEFLTWSYPNGINMGDIIIVSGRWKNNLKVGDVIVFDAGQALPIIHRIIDPDNLSTKGDHNPAQLSFEKKISDNQVIGKAIFRIPKLGWAKLFFVKFF